MVNIMIDRLTNCIVERSTGTILDTEYRKRTLPLKKKDYSRWKFNWSLPIKNGYDIYELFLVGNNVVQGRIAVKIEGGVAEVDIVESAPHNLGHRGRYEGVGGNLFAIACQCSLDAGCDGVVAFTAKSNLVEHYKNTLHAVEIMPRRMVIFEDAAQVLIDKYLR